MMEINQNKNELHLYPINDDNEYMGAINVMGATVSNNSIQTVVILDSSGSMGPETARFVKEILPLVMSKLNWSKGIDLINFSKKANWKHLTLSELMASDITSDGKSCLAPAIRMFRLCLESIQENNPGQPIRVLTVSDGEISDSERAEGETKKLVDFLATAGMTINSQAVRLFTSSTEQPDTKALSYLLQINNTNASNLCDITVTSSNESIASAIADLFQPDGFANCQTLQLEQSIILKFPWCTDGKMRIILTPGWNIFWLRAVPTGVVKLGNDPLKVIVESPLSLSMFHQLLETKLAHIVDHVAILKIVGTPEANTAVDQIFTYFKTTEDALAIKSSTRNIKIISNLLVGIAKKNIDNDSAQMAEFLRSTEREIQIQLERKQEAEDAEKHSQRIVEEERIDREEKNRFELEEMERLKREEAKRLKLEEECRIIEAEEEHLRQEEEERKRQEEEERKRQEEEERKRQEEEERKRQEELKRLEEAERKRLVDEERKRQDDEERKRLAEDERVRREREEERPNPPSFAIKIDDLVDQPAMENSVNVTVVASPTSETQKNETSLRKREEEEEEHLKREEERKLREETLKRRKEEREKREEEECFELEELKKREEEAKRLKREEECRIKEAEESLQQEEEERERQEKQESKRQEDEELKKLEQDRKEKDEEILKPPPAIIIDFVDQTAMKNSESVTAVGTETQINESSRHKREEEEERRKLEEERNLREAERIKLEVDQRAQREHHFNEKPESVIEIDVLVDQAAVGNSENITANALVTRRNIGSLITTALNRARQLTAAAIRSGRNSNSDPNPIQTVFILHENVYVAKKHCRFAEKIIPLVFSKISNGNSQLVHLLTVATVKTPVVQMLQTILQTLDANKPIRIMVLTDMYSGERRQLDGFAELLVKFLSGSNFSFEFQVIRIASECQEKLSGVSSVSNKYQLLDIDSTKSNSHIAAQIVELFHSNNFPTNEPIPTIDKNDETEEGQLTDVVSLNVDSKQSEMNPNLNCESCRVNTKKTQRNYFFIYIVIFAIPIALLLFDIIIYLTSK